MTARVQSEPSAACLAEAIRATDSLRFAEVNSGADRVDVEFVSAEFPELRGGAGKTSGPSLILFWEGLGRPPAKSTYVPLHAALETLKGNVLHHCQVVVLGSFDDVCVVSHPLRFSFDFCPRED